MLNSVAATHHADLPLATPALLLESIHLGHPWSGGDDRDNASSEPDTFPDLSGGESLSDPWSADSGSS